MQVASGEAKALNHTDSKNQRKQDPGAQSTFNDNPQKLLFEVPEIARNKCFHWNELVQTDILKITLLLLLKIPHVHYFKIQLIVKNTNKKVKTAYTKCSFPHKYRRRKGGWREIMLDCQKYFKKKTRYSNLTEFQLK